MVLSSATPALVAAGGWDTLSIGSNELLFDDSRFAFEVTARGSERNVEYEAVNPQFATGAPVTTGPATSHATPNVWFYQGAAKARLTDNIDCMVRAHNPYQIQEDLNPGWQGRFSLTKTDAESTAWDGTCSYKFQVRDGHFVRAIAGAELLHLSYISDNFTFIPGLGAAPSTVGVSSDDPGVGWRIGASYEIPQYAIRASIIYDSPIDMDLSGTTTVGPGSFDSFASVTMPQSVEVNLQTGIAPRWLATLGVKWQNWADVSELTVTNPTRGVLIDRVLDYDDGWTVRGGIGHQFNDWLQFGGTVQWDRGIGQSYSDTYTFGLGTGIQFNEHMYWEIASAATYKTSGSGDLTNVASPTGAATDFRYDGSWNYVMQTKLKFTF